MKGINTRVADGIDPNVRPSTNDGSYYPVAEVGGLKTNRRPAAYGPNLPPPPPSLYSSPNSASGFDPLVTGWTDLAARGAQTFYAGVKQAGRLVIYTHGISIKNTRLRYFGIDTGQYQQYEVPLISQGARFFGRKKRTIQS